MFRSLTHPCLGRFCQESKIGGADAVGALDRFCPASDNPAAGAWTLPPAERPTCCTSMRPGISAFAPADRRWRRRSGSVSGSDGVRAVAEARAARRAALTASGYLRCAEAYHHAGVNLAAEPLIGIGS